MINPRGNVLNMKNKLHHTIWM